MCKCKPTIWFSHLCYHATDFPISVPDDNQPPGTSYNQSETSKHPNNVFVPETNQTVEYT